MVTVNACILRIALTQLLNSIHKQKHLIMSLVADDVLLTS